MKKSIENRIVWIASLGSILEYYDFVVYAMFAKYLKIMFFPNDNEITSALQLFSVFAIGYLVRPLGGIVAGSIGDRIGRKPAFLFLTFLMAISTLLIGFLPTYSYIGSMATIFLILCRIGQGLSFGGELPAATTIVGEFSNQRNRGFRISFVVASTSIGALLASVVLFILTHFLTELEILQWGWRLPFVIGGVSGMGICWLRKSLAETPEFQSEHNRSRQHKPLIELINYQPISIIVGIMLTAFVSSMVISNLYFPYYIHQYFGYAEKNIYLASTFSLIFSCLILPVSGKLADYFPTKQLLKWIIIGYLFSSYFLFKLLTTQDFYMLVAFMMIHQLFIALFSSCYYPIIINLFSTRIRYTGIATCYNITYALMGMLPTALTTLLDKFQTPSVVPIILSAMAGISLFGIFWVDHIKTNSWPNPFHRATINN